MEKLEIYQKALILVKRVYSFINTNSNLKADLSLIDQLKRAAVSVTLNIAEGYGRGSKQYKSYLKIATGSVNEVIAIFQIINQVNSIDTVDIQNDYLYLGKQISTFSKSFT